MAGDFDTVTAVTAVAPADRREASGRYDVAIDPE
jgi:hypothetical protein